MASLLATAIGAEAHASVVRELSPAELEAGADAVVEGIVGEVVTRWNPGRTGLETRISVAVTRVARGQAPARIEIVQPGGELAGNRHIIPGMPSFAPGEDVRVHLRERAGGGYRVYGWAQGKWLGHPVAGAMVYAPAPPPARAARDGVIFYTHNGMVWPQSKIPVAYFIDQDGSDDVAADDARSAIFAAFATWEAVPCSTLAYTYAGDTDRGVAIDGDNVILWIEEGWIYGEEAAAATSLWIPIEDQRTADVAFNGEGFAWAVEPEPAISFATLDIQAVLTHELGHFSGLGHTESSVDTMYVAWRPWQGQRTLSADDERGLCALYPQLADECADDDGCPGDEACIPYEHGTLCTSPADPVGTPCNYTRIECEQFCLFTAADLSAGYCSRYCERSTDCPVGFRCDDASAGETPVRVCFADPASQPDAGAGADDCVRDDDCPAGRHCGADLRCTYECVEPIDCPAGRVCGDRGRCAAAADGTGGCGCRGGGPGRASWLWALAAFVLVRRLRASARPAR